MGFGDGSPGQVRQKFLASGLTVLQQQGRGRQSGEALNSLPPSSGTVAMVKASTAQSRMIAFRLEKGVFLSNFAEHFTENPRSRAARVSRKTDDSEAKMDKNPTT